RLAPGRGRGTGQRGRLPAEPVLRRLTERAGGGGVEDLCRTRGRRGRGEAAALRREGRQRHGDPRRADVGGRGQQAGRADAEDHRTGGRVGEDQGAGVGDRGRVEHPGAPAGGRLDVRGQLTVVVDEEDLRVAVPRRGRVDRATRDGRAGKALGLPAGRGLRGFGERAVRGPVEGVRRVHIGVGRVRVGQGRDGALPVR